MDHRSAALFTLLVVLVALERFAELLVARAHERRSFALGGIEHGRGHYPVMVALHTGLLAGAVVEVWWRQPAFVPALGWSMLTLVVLAQALRWWCITALGDRWTTRVVVVPGLPLVRRGPYRLLRHPNYVAVVVEGVALPLVHSAWITAVCFTAANAVLLLVRIRVEDRALARTGGAA